MFVPLVMCVRVLGCAACFRIGGLASEIAERHYGVLAQKERVFNALNALDEFRREI